MNASPANHSLLDNIQKKALKIIGTNEATALAQLTISSLLPLRRARIPATTLLYKMHSSNHGNCPTELRSMLSPSYVMQLISRNSLSMSVYAFGQYNLFGQQLSVHCGQNRNNLPDNVVSVAHDSGIQAFKRRVRKHLLISGVTLSLYFHFS